MLAALIPGVKTFFANNLFSIIKFAVIGLAILAAYLYWNWSQKEIQTLRTNQVILEKTITDQQSTIESILADYDSATESLKKIIEKNTTYNAELMDLYTKFTKNGRSLKNLAKKKPALIQNVINEATKKAIECNEALTRGEQCAK